MQAEIAAKEAQLGAGGELEARYSKSVGRSLIKAVLKDDGGERLVRSPVLWVLGYGSIVDHHASHAMPSIIMAFTARRL